MNYIKYNALIILIFSLIGCQKEITLENPNKVKVLVVNGYVSPDQGAIVDVSHSITDITDETISALKDAKVALYEDDVLLGNLEYTELGSSVSVERAFYSNSELEIKEGVQYRIDVDHSDYENITATTTVPELSIIQPKLEYTGIVDEYSSSLKLTIEESIPGDHYYAFIVTDRTRLYEVIEGDTLELSWSDGENVSFVEFEEAGLSELASTGLEIHQSNLDESLSAIDNSFFINGKMELSFNIYTTQTPLLQNEFFVNEVNVEVRQMSKEYFEYIKTLSIQEKVSNDPFATEVIVSNNIEGGLGNFSGFQMIKSNKLKF